MLLLSTSLKSQEYPKVIIPGDYPDPTIMREGKDYYMTHSAFYYAPGFLIWHSQDLINWKPICRVVKKYRGSAFAPDLVKHDGKYYIYYPADGTNWVVWSDNIKGPWSEPIDLKVKGIDPGHVVEEDGKRYLFLSDGNSDLPMVQLADDGLSIIGSPTKVYSGWKFPEKWKTEGLWLESPKLVRRGDYFYLTTAEGGTAGPPTSHMIVSARSKSVFGPWENSPYNPIVHTYSEKENWWSKGHGTIIDDINGNWWAVYHGYANGYYTLGRQTLIEPIEWTSDGWYTTAKESKPIMNEAVNTRVGLELSDDFSNKDLGLQWTFWREDASDDISIQSNTLSLKAKGVTPDNARILLTTPSDKSYETQVDLQAGQGNSAGLILYYSEKAYAGIVTDGKTFTIYEHAGKSRKFVNKFGKKLSLKITNKGNMCDFLASQDGQNWEVIASRIDVSQFHHNNYKGFYALRIALLSAGKGEAKFQRFRYKNAVPTEKDMSAYLMVYFKDETHDLYMALSNDGYSFSDVNYGQPVLAGDTIATQKGIRDPHIFRGPDGAFYLAMTDLHIFAQKEGLRNTEWERDGRQYGWGNNRGLVLMKSWDLISWTRATIEFDKLSAGLSEVGCVWAPELIYDEMKQKIMIYYTMRFRKEPAKICYVYVNEDFNKIESTPTILFEYPDEQVTAIDADITKVNGMYRMFFVAHDGEPGIKQAVSTNLTGPYQVDARWYDSEPKACEAPNVWKRIGEDKWVLMYDIYSINPPNFGFRETTDFVTFKDLGHFNSGVMKSTNFSSPKHGAVIHLTHQEAEKLAQHFRKKPESH